jgi:hypothetical protein
MESPDTRFDVGFEDMTVPVPLAAALLGTTPHEVSRLLAADELTCVRERNRRYVTLSSLFAYRRAHFQELQAQLPAAEDDTAALDAAADRLA